MKEGSVCSGARARASPMAGFFWWAIPAGTPDPLTAARGPSVPHLITENPVASRTEFS